MTTASFAARAASFTAIASLFAAAVLATGPALAQADAQPLTRAQVRGELDRAQAAGELDAARRWGVQTPPAYVSPAAQANVKTATPVPVAQGLTREEVKAELFRARAAGDVQLGGYSGYFFEPVQARSLQRVRTQDTRSAE